MMKGIRQAQAFISASLNTEVRMTTVMAAINAPRPWLANWKLPRNPRLPSPCAMRYEVAAPNSPPAEKPWIRRPRIRPIGARMPMASYPGMKAITAVPSTINRMVSIKPFFMPLRSAYEPRIKPPNGRIR